MINQQKIIPKHIAIIMDGNRRWAKARGLTPIAGHKYVADNILEPLIQYASDIGISCLTLWAFSTENWQRDPIEVSGIMKIFRNSLITMGKRMNEKGARIRVIGNMEKFDKDIQRSVADLVDLTKNNTKITVVFALNYGGRDEIMRACQKTIHDANFSEKEFTKYLDTAGIPDPELIVRTGGEQRLSGFLLWQCQYSELYFPSWFMPEFTPEKLDEAIIEYTNRHRRFGK